MNSRHPDHPRYCSPKRAAELRRIGPEKARFPTLPCKELEFNKLGQHIGTRFYTGASGKVAGTPYEVVATRKREGKGWVTTGARIERARI